MANYKNKTKEQIIRAEKKKLAEIYEKLDEKMQKAVDSLVEEAAFMAASLYELRVVIDQKGYVEEYRNGANQHGIKKCSEVEIYNTMIKNYMSVVKQLTDLIPKKNSESAEEWTDGFEEFVNARD